MNRISKNPLNVYLKYEEMPLYTGFAFYLSLRNGMPHLFIFFYHSTLTVTPFICNTWNSSYTEFTLIPVLVWDRIGRGLPKGCFLKGIRKNLGINLKKEMSPFFTVILKAEYFQWWWACIPKECLQEEKWAYRTPWLCNPKCLQTSPLLSAFLHSWSFPLRPSISHCLSALYFSLPLSNSRQMEISMCLRVSRSALLQGWDKQKDSIDLVSSRAISVEPLTVFC